MHGIEYWRDGRGREPVREYVSALRDAGEKAQVAVFERLLRLLAAQGPAIGMPMARLINRRERLYELRFGDHRCAYAQAGDAIVLLHGGASARESWTTEQSNGALRRLTVLRKEERRP